MPIRLTIRSVSARASRVCSSIHAVVETVSSFCAKLRCESMMTNLLHSPPSVFESAMLVASDVFTVGSRCATPSLSYEFSWLVARVPRKPIPRDFPSVGEEYVDSRIWPVASFRSYALKSSKELMMGNRMGSLAISTQLSALSGGTSILVPSSAMIVVPLISRSARAPRL